MMQLSQWIRSGAVLFALVMLTSAFAQPATVAQKTGVKDDAGFGTMHFRASIGSGKFIDGTGRVEFNIRGTFMISGLKGTRAISGKFIKEYDKRGRELFRGEGKIVVTGSWRGMQFFGRGISGVWYGRGVMRVSGEFDKNGNTGDLWYDDPTKIKNWPATGSFDQFLPSRDMNDRTPKPVRRKP